jgi:hypothetical protein
MVSAYQAAKSMSQPETVRMTVCLFMGIDTTHVAGRRRVCSTHSGRGRMTYGFRALLLTDGLGSRRAGPHCKRRSVQDELP